MSDSNGHHDVWRFFITLLWLPFFAAGLVPEETYGLLRELGGVVTQRALVNSATIITLMLSFYMALFCYHRCIETGMAKAGAQARALQVCVIALVAFLPYPFELILTPGSIMLPAVGGADGFIIMMAVFGLPLAKVFAWLYLFGLLVRYHLLGNDTVFRDMFPPVAVVQAEDKDVHAEDRMASSAASHHNEAE